MVCIFSNKQLTRVSRKTIIAGLRQVAGKLVRAHPDPAAGKTKFSVDTIKKI
jgi:hypothetical protein